MPPAAPFLGRQEMEERTGQRGFPLCDSPTPGVNSARLSARLQIRCADSALPARASPLLAYRPFRSHARVYVLRRDGRHSLSVLPETGWKLSHSRSRSQAATADDLSSARRRREPRHAGGIPKGKALWLLLHTSGRAEVCPRRDREKSPTNSNLSKRIYHCRTDAFRHRHKKKETLPCEAPPPAGRFCCYRTPLAV